MGSTKNGTNLPAERVKQSQIDSKCVSRTTIWYLNPMEFLSLDMHCYFLMRWLAGMFSFIMPRVSFCLWFHEMGFHGSFLPTCGGASTTGRNAKLWYYVSCLCMVPVSSKMTSRNAFKKSVTYRGTYVIQICQLLISDKCSSIKILVADNRF